MRFSVGRISAALAHLVVIAGSAWGQLPSRAAASFSPDSLRRLVQAIAHDSMGGRATPSPGLEATARFIAETLTRSGLTPAGDDGTYFQRYPVIETSLNPDSTRIEIGSLANWRFGQDFFYGGGQGTSPFGSLRGEALIVSGSVPRETANTLGVSRKIVVYLPPSGTRRADAYRSVFAIAGAGATAVIVGGNLPDSTWTQLKTDPDEFKPMTGAAWPVWTATKPAGHVPFVPVLELWRGRLRGLVAQAGIDSGSLSAPAAAPIATPLQSEGALHFPREIRQVSQPANVVALLPGSDSLLRHEYVVVTAHFDGLGTRQGFPPGPASILNGADDNASGVAVMIQVAQAAAKGPRAKRSILFVAVSGEELGLWGSDYFAGRPPVPRASIVANINFDMVGRSNADSVFILGRSNRVIGPTVNRALAKASSLRLVVLDDAAFARRYPSEPLDDRSDHANFARGGIPWIYFFTGWHEDYHGITDDSEKLNYDALSRIARVAHSITLELANARLPRSR